MVAKANKRQKYSTIYETDTVTDTVTSYQTATTTAYVTVTSEWVDWVSYTFRH